MFPARIKGEALYTVVCPYSTPPGKVKKLTSEMKLYILGTSVNGLIAFSQEVARNDETESVNVDHIEKYRQEGRVSIQEFTEVLANRLRCRSYNVVPSQRRLDFVAFARTADSMSLEDIATGCVILGISFKELAGAHY